jgi:hypothetical protein
MVWNRYIIHFCILFNSNNEYFYSDVMVDLSQKSVGQANVRQKLCECFFCSLLFYNIAISVNYCVFAIENI